MSPHDEDSSEAITAALEDFKAVNHNPTNYEGYKRFQSFVDERYAALEEEASRSTRALNVKRWDESLPKPWSEARLSTLRDKDAARAALAVLAKKNWSGFYIRGESGTGKTFLAHAMIRKLIGVGFLVPEQVKHLSEARLLAPTKAGFKGQEAINELFDRRYKLYLIDGVSSKAAYTDAEISLWEQFLDHVTTHNLSVIFTSSSSARSFLEKLSNAGQAKLAHLIHERVLTMNGVTKPPTIDDEMTEAEKATVREAKKVKTVFEQFTE